MLYLPCFTILPYNVLNHKDGTSHNISELSFKTKNKIKRNITFLINLINNYIPLHHKHLDIKAYVYTGIYKLSTSIIYMRRNLEMSTDSLKNICTLQT